MTFNYIITKSDHKTPIYKYLASKGYSNQLRITLKQHSDSVLLNGTPVFLNYQLEENDTLTITLPKDNSSHNIVPTPMNLSILYEDEHILLVNKDSNIPIHPSQGNYDNTLANGVMWYQNSKKEPIIYRVINRLDRDTTGLVLIAKHALSGSILSDMVSKRMIQRTYLSVVKGDVSLLEEKEGIHIIKDPELFSFEIDAPIARKEDSTIERIINFETGEHAKTYGTLLEYNREKDLSLLQIRLGTGRTHQIRVHMSYCNHPLPGDFLYCPDYTYIKRQSLHSWKLAFTHPITGVLHEFIAPLPQDMLHCLNQNKQPT